MHQSLFVSVIIPTIGRDSLSKAVESIFTQEFAQENYEIIVVNDSGLEIPEASWQQSSVVKLINTQKRERGFARNTGAAIARGKYLLFLDDDDWLQTEAFQKLYDLTLSKEAGIYYGGYNLVDGQGKIFSEVQPDEEGNCLIRLMIGEWLPLGTYVVASKTFFEVNGFDTDMVPYEDIAFAVKIANRYDFAVTNGLIANILRDYETSTTDYTTSVLRFRKHRERILALPNTYQRLRDSAFSRPVRNDYWIGRVSATYFASMAWNTKNKRLLTAIKMALLGLFNLLGSGKSVLRSDFWHAIKPPQRKGHFNSRDFP